MNPPLFATRTARCTEMSAGDVPRLQRFLEANPEYDLAVNGEPPHPGEAQEEFDSRAPPDWPQGKKWFLAFDAPGGGMVGMADVIADLLAPSVWHIGLFIVATRLHGSGAARDLYDALEAWMKANGARWSRLGVVAGNARAERFWERCGYVETRVRPGITMGRRTNDIRVMLKPLSDGRLDEYLSLVPRDLPDAQ